MNKNANNSRITKEQILASTKQQTNTAKIADYNLTPKSKVYNFDVTAPNSNKPFWVK